MLRLARRLLIPLSLSLTGVISLFLATFWLLSRPAPAFTFGLVN